MNELLSISIPTYNRSKYLAALLLSIDKQYTKTLSKFIHIYIYDNNSNDETEQLLKYLGIKFEYTYLKHVSNMGGLYNIHYSYTNTHGKYTWVIGDDEILPNNSLEYIINIINDYSPGLIIPGSSLGPLENTSGYYNTYGEFASDCMKNRPHLLIEHSLISANIIRSDCYDRVFAENKLEAMYFHFYAIINGIISKKASVFNTKKLIMLVRSKRAPMDIGKRDSTEAVISDIAFEQNMYLNWLLGRLKNSKTIDIDTFIDSETRLNHIWNLPIFKDKINPDLKLVQSMIFDNQLKEHILINKNPNYKDMRQRENSCIQSVIDSFDSKVMNFYNSSLYDVSKRKIFSNPQNDDSVNSMGNSIEIKSPNIENILDEIPISLSLTVYNEENRIFYVLASAITWANEVIVFNKSSTDRTKEICLQFGEKVKVIDVPFSPAGHGGTIANSKVPANDWIYYTTASEIPTKKLIEQIKQILHDSRGGLDLIYVPRKYFSLGIHDKRSPWSISYFPFLVNRKKAIITDTIHKNFRPSDPSNTKKIEYDDDCCVYHLTHSTAKDYLHSMTDYFELEAKGCENPTEKIQECMLNIAKFDKQLQSGGDDLLGHFFAWRLYWLGTALFVWEKERGIDVSRYYEQLRESVLKREWLNGGNVFGNVEYWVDNGQKLRDKPLVSAIISTYNSERFIRGCLEDLESQTIRDKLEIIMVDCASDENNETILKEFQDRYYNIQYLKTEGCKTVYAAWNRGIKAASGKYITCPNTDDRHAPYAFERMVHVLDNNPDISLVYADVWITEKENETFNNFTASGNYCWRKFDPESSIDGCYVGPQPMWRKDIHEEHGFFDEKFHSVSNWEFWLRVSETRKFMHLDEFMGLYLKSASSEEYQNINLESNEHYTTSGDRDDEMQNEKKQKKFLLAAWGYYEQQYYDNWIFHNAHTSIGDNLLKPMNELFKVASFNNIEIKSLDTIKNYEEIDAFIFLDFPDLAKATVKKAFTMDKPRYLMAIESPIVRPQNWSKENQSHFKKIFTFLDDVIDNKKFFKINYTTEFPSHNDTTLGNKNKFCAMIVGNKNIEHKLSLYKHRKEAIRWFENNHPEEFDLFGVGWDPNEYPSYKGRVDSKIEILRNYRFSICYENVKDINGYITEKIFDCFKAGCVPIYWGARNISQFIPKDCFIDKRNFSDYESLYVYLKGISNERYLEYLNSIEAFFNSPSSYPFTTELFVKTVLEEISNRPINYHFQASAEIPASMTKKEKYGNNQIYQLAGEAPPKACHKDPLVSMIITHFNRLDCIKACIESIKRHTTCRYELIIVENGSTDGISKDYLRSLPNITLIENKTNIGCDKAGLQALALANGDFIAGLTNDIIVTPGWLDLFLNHMYRNPEVGLIGPRSNLVSGPQVVPGISYQNTQELDRFAQEWTERYRNKFSYAYRLVGFCVFYRREILEKIGGYGDPEFGFGFDDDDFTLRSIIAGYDAIIAHDIFIHHTGGPQMRGDSELKKEVRRAWEVYKRKWKLPSNLEYGQAYNKIQLLQQNFDRKRHFIPLPERSDVENLIYRPKRGGILNAEPIDAAEGIGSQNDTRDVMLSQDGKAAEIPISLVLTVYNEEESISYILGSAVKWANEIVVFILESTDETQKICQQFGEKVKVVNIPFGSSNHNDAISQAKIASNDWIFWGTVSEIPTRSLVKRIKKILRDTKGNLDLIYIPRKYYSFGIHDKRSPWSISHCPLVTNRKKTIISNTTHKNHKPTNPNNTMKIEFTDDCCVYHLAHTTAKSYLRGITGQFEKETTACENPSTEIHKCMSKIAQYENQLKTGGDDLQGHYFAWQIYWLGKSLFLWEKWRGINVSRYYDQLRQNVLKREWLDGTNEIPHLKECGICDSENLKDKPIVSAIVSACNSERFIRGCLEDLESQTIRDELEIIVVDSASDQNEEAIVKDFQKKYSNIKYLKTKRRETVYAAWNRGIKAASGIYVTNANTDDRHVPYAFERMAHVLDKNPDISLVYADVWITEKENETFENFTPSGYFQWKDFDPKTLIEGCYIGPQPMWRKNIHERHGYFEATFQSAGDWEFWLRIAQTEKFLHLREYLGLYLKSSTGIENRDPKISGEEFMLIREQYGAQNAKKMHETVQMYLNSGRKKEAKATLLKLIEKFPDSAAGHNDLAVLYINENNTEKALAHYQKAMELEPDNPTFAKNIADLYFVKLGRSEKALEIYVKLLTDNPKDIEILTALGHICVSLGKFENARTFFRRILETDPWNQDVQNILDGLAKHQGMETLDQKRKESEKKETALNVDSAEKMYRDALELIEKEENEEGIKALERLLDSYPDFGLAHNDLGVLHYQKGEKEKALNHYEHAARLEPQNDTFQKNLADFYFVEAGRVQEALQIYTKLLESNPADIEILLIIAQICESLEKTEDAEDFYKKVLSIEPWNTVARQKIADSPVDNGKDFDNNGGREEFGLHSDDVWPAKSAVS
jgi:glycosyltransferase involved in cell wall biosynthesis